MPAPAGAGACVAATERQTSLGTSEKTTLRCRDYPMFRKIFRSGISRGMETLERGARVVYLLDASRLGEMWPDVRARVLPRLRAVGTPPDVAEDALADAAVRALARPIFVGGLEDFCRWAFVVARNVVFDGHRRGRRLVFVDALPERADDCDVSARVEGRSRLQQAVEIIGGMSAIDRAALLDGISGAGMPPDRREAVKHAVRRHRARTRLRHALGAPVGWCWPSGFSRLCHRVQSGPIEGAIAVAVALPLLVAAFASAPASARGGQREGDATPAASIAPARAGLGAGGGSQPVPVTMSGGWTDRTGRDSPLVSPRQDGPAAAASPIPDRVASEGKARFVINPTSNVGATAAVTVQPPAVELPTAPALGSL